MLKLFAAITVAVASAAPAVRSGGPVEVDLSGLPGVGNGITYRLRLTFTNAAGSTFDQEYRLTNSDPTTVAEVLAETFPAEVRATRDGAKLRLVEFNGRPIARVAVTATGVPEGTAPPTARRLLPAIEKMK